MNHLQKIIRCTAIMLLPLAFAACKKADDLPAAQSTTITVENILKSAPLVESGTFQNTGASPLIMPGQNVSIHFSAAKGEALSFATMYGWSNDLFFAPANPGIAVYDAAGTANATPLSPGVWSVSYIVGGQLLNAAPLYTPGKPTANGLTSIAEMGNNMPLSTYISGITGIFTPLSPILVVVYNGIENPIYKVGEADRGKGLTLLAQRGNADTLAAALRTMSGVKSVYVLAAPTTRVLLPVIDGQPGGIVSQQLSVSQGDRVAIATMYGFSNDWFFASADNGADATQSGDISSGIKLYNDGTAIDQFPGAGITQFNLAGTPLAESKPIDAVPNPNLFTTLPGIQNFIRVTLQKAM